MRCESGNCEGLSKIPRGPKESFSRAYYLHEAQQPIEDASNQPPPNKAKKTP